MVASKPADVCSRSYDYQGMSVIDKFRQLARKLQNPGNRGALDDSHRQPGETMSGPNNVANHLGSTDDRR